GALHSIDIEHRDVRGRARAGTKSSVVRSRRPTSSPAPPSRGRAEGCAHLRGRSRRTGVRQRRRQHRARHLGSGDTLSGVIAGLCARGADLLQATVWGVHAHAAAGDRLARRIAPVGYLARELLAEIPQLIAGWRPRAR
ncbi:MAG: hypothetical protein IAG13_27825, partial [Deltaproteobacteria bacterium]|nr:hypothetical protein [Nannocystaceae bacterium]